MGAIKKAFYLSAIKESTTAFGRFPPKAGEQSCRWELQRGGAGEGPQAETRTGARRGEHRRGEGEQPAERAPSTQIWPLFLQERSSFNLENHASTMKNTSSGLTINPNLALDSRKCSL